MIGIFLPERIGNYFLLAKKVAGIQITKEAVTATVMTLKGNSRTVTAFYEVPITESIPAALSALKEQLGPVDEVRCALSSSQVIFKELTLPFIGQKKVELVIPFEVEQLLPFNLEEGLIDSIVTREHDNQTDVLVAAIKQESRNTYVGYFMEADLPLDTMTVDMFELYGLYREQNTSGTDSGVTGILVDLGHSSSHMALLVEGELQYIRSFPQGTGSPEGLIDKIKATAETTLQKYAPGSSLKKVILSGDVSDHIKEQFGMPVELFIPKKLKQVTFNTDIPSTGMVALATAYSPVLTDGFTLLQEKALAQEDQRITRQLITAGILAATILVTFFLYSMLRVRSLRQAHQVAEKEAIAELQKTFKLKPAKTQTLQLANKTALAELHKQETVWRRMSPDNRYAYLKYLAELTKCIDKKESRLQLESIILKDDTIKLYGSVPEYHNLPKLQKQLECKPFLRVAKLQDPNFKTEPITLTVDPREI